MYGVIGYKFCWLLPHSRSTSWTRISWDTNWARIKLEELWVKDYSGLEVIIGEDKGEATSNNVSRMKEIAEKHTNQWRRAPSHRNWRIYRYKYSTAHRLLFWICKFSLPILGTTAYAELLVFYNFTAERKSKWIRSSIFSSPETSVFDTSCVCKKLIHETLWNNSNFIENLKIQAKKKRERERERERAYRVPLWMLSF